MALSAFLIFVLLAFCFSFIVDPLYARSYVMAHDQVCTSANETNLFLNLIQFSFLPKKERNL